MSVGSKIRGKNARRNPETVAMRPQRRMGIGKGCPQTQKKRKKDTFYCPSCRSLGDAGTLFDKSRRASIRHRIGSVHAHAEQKESKLRWFGNSSKIPEFHNGGNGHWRSAGERGSTSTRTRSSSLRDCAIARRHSCRPVVGQALRRARLHLGVGQWSKATSDQRWEEQPLQDWELRSFGGPWTIIEFQHELLLDISSAGLSITSSKFAK